MSPKLNRLWWLDSDVSVFTFSAIDIYLIVRRGPGSRCSILTKLLRWGRGRRFRRGRRCGRLGIWRREQAAARAQDAAIGPVRFAKEDFAVARLRIEPARNQRQVLGQFEWRGAQSVLFAPNLFQHMSRVWPARGFGIRGLGVCVRFYLPRSYRSGLRFQGSA